MVIAMNNKKLLITCWLQSLYGYLSINSNAGIFS